jgi:hypothetical protein
MAGEKMKKFILSFLVGILIGLAWTHYPALNPKFHAGQCLKEPDSEFIIKIVGKEGLNYQYSFVGTLESVYVYKLHVGFLDRTFDLVDCP